MRPHRALASTLTAPDTAGAAALDDTDYAAESNGCLVQAAAISGTLRGASDPLTTRVDLANLFVGTVEVHLKNGGEVWASCHGKVPLGKAGWERRAGRLGQPIEP
ncbi:hypothetical protein OG453_36660 [Streptomyces sp. NBC_01381]|uniref:hypothetical protein n=1 Tax=Streptomyces sp. NBC_01381 TaxID=2903845 RepID=UPI00224D7450|nr:hypothetical protein [Streptomyces sp. NBC_01381]MCX4672141.1 hypothetical protein [Streptomyces sp. NBC_01381]